MKIQTYHIKMVPIGHIRDATTDPITQPSDAAVFFQEKCGSSPQEEFWVIGLNGRNVPLYAEMIGRGSGNAAIVEMRDVFRSAVSKLAISIIVGHNHPSGDTTPSTEDLALTKRLTKAGEILQIQVLDHLIVSMESVLSFKERGLL